MSGNQFDVGIILKAVGFGMGVVVIVLSILDSASINTYVPLLGIGLTALGLDAFRSKS